MLSTQILTIAYCSSILVLAMNEKKWKNKKILPENSPLWLWQQLWCPDKKRSKSNNENKAIKSSGHWNF